MMTVKTYIDKSTVCDGFGCFAGEPVKAGAIMWKFVEGFDIWVPASEAEKLTPVQKEYVETYFCREGDHLYTSCDNGRFHNHGKNPNSIVKDSVMIASRDIEVGEEIVVDYSTFDDDWVKYSATTNWAV